MSPNSMDLIFRQGNTIIIVMENYEALGRYVAAKEQATNFLNQRDNALRDIRLAAEKSMHSHGGSMGNSLGYDFDPTKIEEALKVAKEAHKNLLQAMEEVNRNAEGCGKPKLDLWPVQGY